MLALLAASPLGSASAEGDPLEAPLVVVIGEPEAEPPEDRTASSEVVEVAERSAGATLADLLDEVAGVRVHRLGGLEARSTVSIRGSSSAQVLVLRDGVPLGSASGAEVDLAELDLAEIERVEVYRGPSAAHFGSGGLGGVVNLVSRAPTRRTDARVGLGLGSYMPGSFDPARVFGFSAERSVSAELRAPLGGPAGPVRLLASARLLGSEGDFVYRDDNGTLWLEDDDAFALRRNNDLAQASFLVRAAADLAPGLSLVASESASVRSAGVPGLGAALSSSARLRTAQSLTTLALDRATSGGLVPRLSARLALRLRRDEWVDREGEIGVGREHDDDLTADATSMVRAGWPLGGGIGTAWLQGELRAEQYFARSRLEARDFRRRRVSGALSGWLSVLLAGGAVELAPQVRLELADDVPTGAGPPLAAGAAPPERASRAYASGQLGMRVRPTGWLSIRAATGYAARPPTFLELLGNRGTVVGNPSLRPETGWFGDAGARLEGRRLGPVESAHLEVTGFYRLVDDLIQLVPNSQVTFVATNVGGARVAGAEASAGLRLDWASATPSPWPGFVTFRAALTLMDAVDRSGRPHLDGRRLPLRPSLETSGRLAASLGPLELAYELDHVSGNFLDPYNSFPVPHRLLHSAEASADLGRWGGPRLSLLVRNLADTIEERVPVRGLGERVRPVADVAGFPLPGLTVLVTARFDLPRGPSSGN